MTDYDELYQEFLASGGEKSFTDYLVDRLIDSLTQQMVMMHRINMLQQLIAQLEAEVANNRVIGQPWRGIPAPNPNPYIPYTTPGTGDPNPWWRRYNTWESSGSSISRDEFQRLYQGHFPTDEDIERQRRIDALSDDNDSREP